jgi:hypothetical protein
MSDDQHHSLIFDKFLMGNIQHTHNMHCCMKCMTGLVAASWPCSSCSHTVNEGNSAKVFQNELHSLT